MVIAGCDAILGPPEQRQTRVDVYADRIEYRTGRYPTPSALAIAIRAAHDPPEVIELHDCARRGDLEGVIEAVRASGAQTFSVVLPNDC